MNQVRVTEALRTQWSLQRDQSLEERTHTQTGIPRSAEDVAIVDFGIEILDLLLSLPLGTKFDAQQVQADLLAQKGKS